MPAASGAAAMDDEVEKGAPGNGVVLLAVTFAAVYDDGMETASRLPVVMADAVTGNVGGTSLVKDVACDD